MSQRRAARPAPASDLTPGMRLVLEAMATQALDPFQGIVERRVMPEGMTSVDMEAEAARAACARAGIEPREIGALLAHTPVPEFLLSNTACVLHAALGLRPECLAMQVDAAGNSFMMQLSVACDMIAGGRIDHALIVQSAAGSRLLEESEVQSPLFGDGAAAAVVSRVDDASILSLVHRTDSAHPRALIATVRGGRWYDDGRISLHRGDLASAFRSFAETADLAGAIIAAALDDAGVRADEIDFFASHQGTPWLRQVVMQHCGLSRARSIDMMHRTGYLFGASVPFVLEQAQREGQLSGGQLVLVLGGGVGVTTTAAVMRWGDR